MLDRMPNLLLENERTGSLHADCNEMIRAIKDYANENARGSSIPILTPSRENGDDDIYSRVSRPRK